MGTGRFPEITTVFDIPSEASNQLLYNEVVRNILKKIVPHEVFDQEETPLRLQAFSQILPIITSTPLKYAPSDVSFYSISHVRTGVFKFFYEMLINWLVPGRRLNNLLIYAVDFKIPEFGDHMYTLCEVMVRIESAEELEAIRHNLQAISTELRLGIESAYHGRRILEVRGLSADVKTAMIQEHIFHIIERLSHTVDNDVLTEMQHLLVMCRDDFKSARNSRHLSRIIVTQYLFRKGVASTPDHMKDKRHVALKLFRANVHHADGEKNVLAVCVGMTFLKDKEIFDQRHLLSAILSILPDVRAVENSFLSNRRGNDCLCMLYLEIERAEGKTITMEQMALLKRDLPNELKSQVGFVMNPVFMPRNEEEIMRNILSLSAQIKYVRDIPQLFISFDEQTQQNLFFSVVAVRVVCPGSSSIQDLFNINHSSMEYIHDRCKCIGIVRKKYAKEATVFRVKLSKERYLRRDQTIDINKARQEVVFELLRVIGEFRDYNGGMISKQSELLDKVKILIGKLEAHQDVLLDNFFYSLTPVVMRTVLEPEALTQFFYMQVEALKLSYPDGKRQLVDIRQTPTHLFAIIKSEEVAIKDRLNQELEKLDLSPTELASSYISLYDHHYFGFIYRNDDPIKQWHFQQTIRQTLSGHINVPVPVSAH